MRVLFWLSLLAISYLTAPAHSRDLGQWEDTPYEIQNWYRHLMMPDSPNTSCCGEADAYWADSFEIVKDPTTNTSRFFAIVTDERDDVKLKRRHIDVGTRIEIPNHKLVDATKQQNPTGHGIVFVGPGPMNNNVYCYLPPGGV